MGYHITLSRRPPNPGISALEWKDFVLSRPELKLVDESDHFTTAIVDGDESLALHYTTSSGDVFTKNPNGPRIIAYMASIAPYFDGIVTGDEGETYTTEADWGTQSDWDSKPSPVPWWKRELPRGKRILLGLLLGVILLVAQQFFAS